MTLREERFFTYDIDRFPFRDVLFQIFGVSDLETIHQTVEGCTEQGYVKFENDQGTYFHKTFYNSPLFHEFLKIYESWIQQVIAPIFKEKGEKEIIYQKRPTFRICLPNNVAVGRLHCDADYNHPEGEINFWVPFTRAFESNAFYLETEPGKEDYRPLQKQMNYGDIFQFWGNKCRHYNLPNTTGVTRLSFDCRIVPGSQWQTTGATSVKSSLKFDIGGYFDRLVIE